MTTEAQQLAEECKRVMVDDLKKGDVYWPAWCDDNMIMAGAWGNLWPDRPFLVSDIEDDGLEQGKSPEVIKAEVESVLSLWGDALDILRESNHLAGGK